MSTFAFTDTFAVSCDDNHCYFLKHWLPDYDLDVGGQGLGGYKLQEERRTSDSHHPNSLPHMSESYMIF